MLVVGLQAGTSALAVGYGPAGCGLGSVVFGSEPGFQQVFAATTNGTSGNQTFGISSGTSNCVPASKAQAFNGQREFLGLNLSSVAKESAQGDGETLRAFATTLGCSSDAYESVAKAMQANHQVIFGKPGVDAVLFQTHRTLQSDQTISKRCSKLI